jgi:hypothetical protein
MCASPTSAYVNLAANPFPGFSGEAGSYPVDLEVPEPGRQSRWKAAFRLVLAVPAIVLAFTFASTAALYVTDGATDQAGVLVGLIVVAAFLGYHAPSSPIFRVTAPALAESAPSGTQVDVDREQRRPTRALRPRTNYPYKPGPPRPYRERESSPILVGGQMPKLRAESEPSAEAVRSTKGLIEVDPQIPDLYASAPEPLPFDPSLAIRAFLLRRDRGNLLLYSVPSLESAAPAVEDLGGISRQFLNHRHEAMFASEGVNAPLFVHENERQAVAKKSHVRATFSRRHTLDDDVEVIPTPGHTSGATTFLWDSGERRLLFTGDTIYLDDGEWVAAVLDSSDRAAYLASLELIRELDFDVLVPWAATAGRPYHSVISSAEARRRIDAIHARVARGEDR